MLMRVLGVDRYPFAVVAVTDVVLGADDAVVTVAITLHGITRTTPIPVRIETGNDEIAVNGRVVLKQTNYGIAPLSILGGAIQVEDEIKLRLWIRARRCFTQACR
jgi:polyisoprenoid-binding protein YceI